MASGHVTALVAIAIDMLTECGLDRRTARRVLRPLLESTMANLSASGPEVALTGTFARGDLVTVRRHLQALSNKQFAAALAAYKLLGRRVVGIDAAKDRLKNSQADPGGIEIGHSNRLLACSFPEG